MKPTTANPAPAGEALSAVEEMVAELGQLRERERDQELRRAYQVAIDRLQALAFRLAKPRPRTVGRPRPLPTKPAPKPQPEPAPEPPPSAPQRSLPLGPVIVARKPKRR